jgi:hypothetical protein
MGFWFWETRWIGILFFVYYFALGVGLLRVMWCKMASCGVRWSSFFFLSCFIFSWMFRLDARFDDHNWHGIALQCPLSH